MKTWTMTTWMDWMECTGKRNNGVLYYFSLFHQLFLKITNLFIEQNRMSSTEDTLKSLSVTTFLLIY